MPSVGSGSDQPGYGGSPIKSPMNKDVNSEELGDHCLAVGRASSCPSSHCIFPASVGFQKMGGLQFRVAGRQGAHSGVPHLCLLRYSLFNEAAETMMCHLRFPHTSLLDHNTGRKVVFLSF